MAAESKPNRQDDLDYERTRLVVHVDLLEERLAGIRAQIATLSDRPSWRLPSLEREAAQLSLQLAAWELRLNRIEAQMEPDRTGAVNVSNEEEFQALMEAIDADFVARGMPVPARQLQALGEVSKRMQLGLVGGPLSKSPPRPGSYRRADLSKRVRDWMQIRYGDKLKIDFSPGSTAVMLRGDAWLVAIPFVYGRVMTVFDPDLSMEYPNIAGPATPNKDVVMNGLRLVRGLTEGLAKGLSKEEIAQIAQVLLTGMQTFNGLDAIARTNEMARAAQMDLRKSAEIAVDDRHGAGLSRWHSLQAVEKLLKVFLDINKKSFPKTHVLADLVKLTTPLGLTLDPADITLIQCSPSVRYEAKAGAAEAVAAHNAAVRAALAVLDRL